MNDMAAFTKSIESRLADAKRQPYWESQNAAKYMANVHARHERFEQMAMRLIDGVIRPHVATLAGYFVNAVLAKNEPARHCTCWFGYCERFPVSAKVAFSIEHDVAFENVAVSFEAAMIPLFIKINEHDKLITPLENVSDENVAKWVEKRLLEFLVAYLQIDRGGDDVDDDTVTDPVCGMRIARASAAATDSYRGHPYYFCSTDCRDMFSREPTAYVEFKPI